MSQVLDPDLPVHPLYHKYWTLPYQYIPYITNAGLCPTVTFPISQVLVPILPLHPLYRKYWSISHSYLPYITSTGHCPTAKPTIFLVLYPYLPYTTSTGPCLTETIPISQELDTVLPIYLLYHKYWTLSYSYLSYITRSGPCPTVTAPISQLLALVLAVHTLYHKNWTLSYSYLSYITRTARSLGTLQPLLHRQCVDHKGASDHVRKAPTSLECDNWRLVRDCFAIKINDINSTFSLQSP